MLLPQCKFIYKNWLRAALAQEPWLVKPARFHPCVITVIIPPCHLSLTPNSYHPPIKTYPPSSLLMYNWRDWVSIWAQLCQKLVILVRSMKNLKHTVLTNLAGLGQTDVLVFLSVVVDLFSCVMQNPTWVLDSEVWKEYIDSTVGLRSPGHLQRTSGPQSHVLLLSGCLANGRSPPLCCVNTCKGCSWTLWDQSPSCRIQGAEVLYGKHITWFWQSKRFEVGISIPSMCS